MVDYTGIERVQELVNRSGNAAFIEALASEIEADYRRWNEFDKSPRHAERFGKRGDGGAGVVAQQGDQSLVEVVHRRGLRGVP